VGPIRESRATPINCSKRTVSSRYGEGAEGARLQGQCSRTRRGEGGDRVWDRAQGPGHHDRIEGRIGERNALRRSSDQRNRNNRLRDPIRARDATIWMTDRGQQRDALAGRTAAGSARNRRRFRAPERLLRKSHCGDTYRGFGCASRG